MFFERDIANAFSRTVPPGPREFGAHTALDFLFQEFSDAKNLPNNSESRNLKCVMDIVILSVEISLRVLGMRMPSMQPQAMSQAVAHALKLLEYARSASRNCVTNLDDGTKAATAGVLALHTLFVLILIWGLHTENIKKPPTELQLVLTASRTIPAKPEEVVLPTMPVEAPPDIIVQSDNSEHTPAAASSTIVLPPRPDPSHPNAPVVVTELAETATLILKILIEADGSISDAKVVTSSGQPNVDDLAIRFVEANWRFRAAVLGGTPIQYWTTIRVPISAR